MRKNFFLSALVLIFFQCKNQPTIVDPLDQKEIDNFNSYLSKPALKIRLNDRDISIDGTFDIGKDSAIVKNVYWPRTDSSLLNDSGWLACHDIPTMSCNVKFSFFRKNTTGDYEFPEYLCIEYQYKDNTVFDTIFLDSVAHFLKSMRLTTKTVNRVFENSILWQSESIENAHMEIKYMEISVDNGLYGAEYYRSYPNLSSLKDGESDQFEGYRYWHSAFSPEGNHFTLNTEQNLLPVIRANVCVRSYPEYDIRISVVKNFN